MRPGSPATGHANTCWCTPGVGMATGDVHVFPSSVDFEYMSSVSPVTLPPDCGACSQTAKRLPAVSTAMVGKLAPVTPFGKLEITWLTQFCSPCGLVTDSATMSHRFMLTLFRLALSWITNTSGDRPPAQFGPDAQG